ncbi:hypothetical protein [Archangium sp.]|nr:hypothetical protein [Archangium sp.]HYO58555.1 hypothetical protein [Archangium sp.]
MRRLFVGIAFLSPRYECRSDGVEDTTLLALGLAGGCSGGGEA